MKKLENNLSIADLLKRKILGLTPLTSEEETTFEQWLLQSEANRIYYEQLQQHTFLQEYQQIICISREEEQWKKLSEQLPSISRKHRKWRHYGGAAVAAVLLFVFGLLWLTDSGDSAEKLLISHSEESTPRQIILQREDGLQWTFNSQDTLFSTENALIRIVNGEMSYLHTDTSSRNEVAYNTLLVPNGGIFSMVLSDGSKVFLNSGSEFRFPEKFSAENREVFLKGEAIFDVVPDPEKPFWVHTGKMHVKVLGTSFSVTAYDNEPFLKTTLLSGKVEVHVDEVKESKTLIPGMQLFWDTESSRMEVRKVDPEPLFLWKDGILVFQEERLDIIMQMLARWYDIEVSYASEAIKKQSFTNRIDRNNSLTEVLNTLTLLGGPKFDINGKSVYVY